MQLLSKRCRSEEASELSIPLQREVTVFNNIAVTTTTAMSTFGSTEVNKAVSMHIEVVGASTPDWFLDIQGKVHTAGTFDNWDYQQDRVAGAAALSIAQLAITDTTRRYYVIRNAPPFVQFVATRTTGNLTVRVSYTTEPFSQELLTTARGSVFVEGPTASDAAEAGNPVQIGGSVDDTSPTAATEGDVRRIRATPEGNVIAEVYRDNISVAKLDDAAFTPATDPVFPIGALADETSPDSVDEGDVGAVAMTLARELYVRPMRRGAGEVIATRAFTGSVSTTRSTLVTPTSGKKIRIVDFDMRNDSLTDTLGELYFSTGANFETTAGKAIGRSPLIDTTVNAPHVSKVWPEGSGPVGAVDDVLSIRTNIDVGANFEVTVHYREE